VFVRVVNGREGTSSKSKPAVAVRKLTLVKQKDPFRDPLCNKQQMLPVPPYQNVHHQLTSDPDVESSIKNTM
jgi:hypothetical protein